MKVLAALTLLCLPVRAADPSADRAFRLTLERAQRTDRYDPLIIKHAEERDLNPRLVKAIIAAESGFSRTALSPKGARGLMQLLPPTAAEMGVPAARLEDPDGNLAAGTAYLRALYREAWKEYGLSGLRYRDGPAWVQRRVVAAYHGGPRLLRRADLPPRTRRYVRDVFSYYRSPVSELRRPLIISEPLGALARVP